LLTHPNFDVQIVYAKKEADMTVSILSYLNLLKISNRAIGYVASTVTSTPCVGTLGTNNWNFDSQLNHYLNSGGDLNSVVEKVVTQVDANDIESARREHAAKKVLHSTKAIACQCRVRRPVRREDHRGVEFSSQGVGTVLCVTMESVNKKIPAMVVLAAFASEAALEHHEHSAPAQPPAESSIEPAVKSKATASTISPDEKSLPAQLHVEPTGSGPLATGLDINQVS
jgi:hypothetical protein